MRWYEGGITDAIALTRQKNAVFVVFIQGVDEKSRQFGDLFNNGNVSAKLESDLFVAIRLEANSVPHQQFAQIYKAATVPSVFFIGKTGAAIGVITEPTNTEEFVEKINGIIAVHTGKNESFIKNEQQASSGSSNVVCENGVCRRLPSDEASAGQGSSSQQLSAEEKVEKAKELIEKKREQKQVEEKEKERANELERRKVGQDIQKLKRWQEDQQLKNIMEEREREKQQERAARERVLAQIAQDKADRAARFSTNQQQSQSQQQNTAPIQRTTPPSSNSNTTRLQFKLPDGSSHTHEFASSEPLEVVRAYISTNLNLSFSNYILSTAFPRREFTDNNNAETLADLGLAPNAVVLILPSGQGTVSTRGGGFIRGLFWTLVAPFLNVFDYLKSFIFGGGPRPTNRVPVNRVPSDGGEASTSRSPPRKRVGETTVIKRQGNIHRLSDKTDSDDENNTWNGNSTQQM